MDRAGTQIDFNQVTKGNSIKAHKLGRRGGARDVKISLSADLQCVRWGSKVFGPKFGWQNKVSCQKIRQVVIGQNTPQFLRFPGHADKKTRSMSVFYSTDEGHEKTLDIFVDNQAQFDYLFSVLEHVVAVAQEERAKLSPDELYLKDMWDRGDADKSGTLTESEIIELIAGMNISMPSSKVQRMFHEFDKDKSRSLDYNEFREFVELLRERKEMKALWSQILKGSQITNILDIDNVNPNDINQTITVNQLLSFWHDVQHNDVGDNDEHALIERIKKFTGMQVDPKNPRISYVMWTSLMAGSPENDAYDLVKTTRYQDMTQPLSYYYIASSHNTYLEGDQLMSNSSVQRYIDDLTSGCRCVELDCWDGDSGEPIIYHGHTLTTKIFFKDVIEAIRQYGFRNSPYPIILSIENHCSLTQQQRMAQIMKTILGPMLAMPMRSVTSRTFRPLPSPQDLQNKVLIKGKRIGDPPIDDEEEEENEDGEISPRSKDRVNNISSNSSNNSLGGSEGTGKKKGKSAKGHDAKVHQELSDITYLSTGKVHDFDASGNTSIPCDNMCSFSENTTTKYLKNEAKTKGWTLHNKNHLSRIYPKGTRVDSSNYDPAPAWAAGNHLVALNYQTPDVAMHVNRGRFIENGNCGYVLKPGYMLSPSELPNPGVKVHVTVYSAHQLPKPGGAQKGEVIDPFVVITVHGVPQDVAEARTKVIDNNGFNPIWNEVKTFTISSPDTAVLNFEVLDEDVASNDFIGFCSIPVHCLQPGFRNCKLYDPHGRRENDFAFATLFLHIGWDFENFSV